MKELSGSNNIIGDHTSFDKGILVGRDELAKQRLQSICKDLGDDPIGNIAEPNGFEVLELVRIVMLGDRDYVCFVKLFKEESSVEKGSLFL